MVTITSVREQIIKQLDKMSEEQLRLVLGYTRQLGNPLPPGVPGEVLLERAKEINFAPEDLEEIAEAIKDCERIDWSEW